MPDRKGHLNIDQFLFGRTFDRVHAQKDVYAKYLGPSHRRIAHDPLSNMIIAAVEYPNDPLRAFLAAQVHDLVDQASTSLKRSAHRRR